MDIVIPYKNSASNGLELRYTLRGIQQFVPDVENVFIIGDCPLFLQNIIHIPAENASERHHKQRNIYLKLRIGCQDKRVSDSFAWFCDDHFLLRLFKPNYNYRTTLQESISNFTIHQTYRNTLMNTYKVLQGGFDYGHGPMVLEKEKFVRAMDPVNWDEPWGYAIKALYCGLNGIHGDRYADLKIKQPMGCSQVLPLIAGRPYFSIDDRGLNEDMKQVLENLYPNKSIYEND